MTSDNSRQAQAFVVDISHLTRNFLLEIQTGAESLLGAGFTQEVITQIFHESTRQVFDILTPDFSEFSLEIQTAPDWQYIINASVIMANPVLESGLRGAIQRYGLGLWLTLSAQKFFTQPKVFVLQNVDIDCVCFIAYGDNYGSNF